MERWPGAEITEVRGPQDAPAEASAASEALPPADDDGFGGEMGENWVRDDGLDDGLDGDESR